MAGNNKTETQQGGYNDFTLVERFKSGYRNREDITTLPPGVMVQDSQNVLTDTFQRVGIRKGYTLDGAANSALAPIANDGPAMGVFDWFTTMGSERNMRAGFLTSAGNDGKLQFRLVKEDGSIEWTDIVTDLTSVDFNFITFWNPGTLETLLLFVNGESNIRSWNGAYLSVTSGANPTGIVALIAQPGGDTSARVSGGKGFVANDVLDLSGGDNNAQIKVLTVASTGQINSASVNDAGTGYVVNDLFYIQQGASNITSWCKVTGVGGGGEVSSFDILNPGAGYTTGTAEVTVGGTGTGLTIDIDSLTGGGILTWEFASDADHGTGYSAATIYTLTGGTGTLAYVYVYTVDSGSILKSGTETWAEAGFSFGGVGTQTVIINGTTYTYDAPNFIGDTTTMYGVTPDPSGIVSGDVVIQGVQTWTNGTDLVGIPSAFKNNLISTLVDGVFVGSLTNSTIYISDAQNFKNYETGSPAHARTVVITSSPRAMIPQAETLYVSAGTEEWYKIDLIHSADLLGTAFECRRIQTTSLQATQSQAWTTKIANQVAFLSLEPVVEAFGPVQDILLAPQMVDLSYTIVNLMNNLDFTGGSAAYFRKILYMAVPREGLVLMYNMTDPANPYWEAPQVMPISRFSIIGGALYGHSSLVSETYKLFDGTNDNGFPIAANATFSFNNYGTRSQTKGYNNFYVEGYISPNTVLNAGIQYDIDGCATDTSFEIDGDDEQIVCIPSDDASLGKAPLGKHHLGGGELDDEDPLNPKFRVILTFPITYFYEDQISFSSEGKDFVWEIIAFGPQLLDGGNLNNSITK